MDQEGEGQPEEEREEEGADLRLVEVEGGVLVGDVVGVGVVVHLAVAFVDEDVNANIFKYIPKRSALRDDICL